MNASLQVLDPGGVPLFADPMAPEGEAALVGHDGATLVLFPSVLEDFGTWRVSTAAWDVSGAADRIHRDMSSLLQAR